MVIALDLKGLSVSTGAACSSGAIEPSHVLTAMGLSPDRARGSIRFSLGKQNTAEDVDFAIRLVPEVVARLREISPVKKDSLLSGRNQPKKQAEEFSGMNKQNQTVAVAMSGGVDSSAVAAMLCEQGYNVVGLTLQLWNQRRLAGREGMPETGAGALLLAR